MYPYQNPIKSYVEGQLQELGITKEEAVRRSGVPEKLVDRFLTDLSGLGLGEKLRVIIMFGSVIGDPVELGPLCGIEFGGEAPAEALAETEDVSTETLELQQIDVNELRKRGVEFPSDGSPPDWDALKQALAEIGINWNYNA